MKENEEMVKKKYLNTAVVYLALIIICMILLMPYVWMILTSFKSSEEVMQGMDVVFPSRIRLSNYWEAIKEMNFGTEFLNSLAITSIGVIGQLLSSLLVAYGFARFESRAKNFLFTLLLATMMLPWVVTMIPSYAIFARLGWVNTFLPFWVPAFTGNALFVFLLRQFIMGLPRDLDEAATIDGCSSFKILFIILLPLMLPAIMTVIVFAFVNYWSDFIGPSIYLRDATKYTLSIGLTTFKGRFQSVPWHLIMAAGLLYALPMIVVFFSVQKAFVEGIVTTGIKV